MNFIYAQEDIKSDLPCLFLAGPSPRSNEVVSWRKEAIQYLESIDFDGYIFIPEPRNGVYPKDYIAQIEWEEQCLNVSDCILFWIPRNLTDMHGLTTNDEWGYWKCKAPEKLVLGFPKETVKVKYQEYYAKKLNIPISNDLRDSLDICLLKLNRNE